MVDARKGITFEFTQAWALHVIKSYSKMRLKDSSLTKMLSKAETDIIYCYILHLNVYIF